jgi:hypothetical protein
MRRKVPLLILALLLVGAAIIVPDRVQADTCDPTGTHFFKTSYGDYNSWDYCNNTPCGPPPEENWCFLGAYDPPTTCCSTWHEEEDPQLVCACVYCRNVWYVCD